MNRKKIILIVAAAVVAVVGAAGATVYLFWADNPPPPNPEITKPEDVTKYLASDQFAKLPVEKKQAYMEDLHRKSTADPRRMMRSARNLSEKEREKLHENMRPVFMARMRQEIDRFYEMPPEQRTAYLDERIDRHEQFRRDRQARRPADERPNDGRRRGPGGRRHHMNPEHLKRMIENTPARDRARFMEFIKAMHKRRKERGLPDHPHRH